MLSDVATIERICAIEAELAQLRAEAYMRAGIPLPTDHARIARIIQFAAAAFSIAEGSILGQTRANRVCRARFAVAWVATQAFGYSSVLIGRALGDRDHSTILAALKRAEEWRAEDDDYREMTDRLLALVIPKTSVPDEEAVHATSH